MIESFPLQWPIGYERESKRKDSLFKMPPDKARKDLLSEIHLLSGDRNPIISSNVPLRKDGIMYADVANDQLRDPGVAVYFQYNSHQVTLACDAWLTPAENIRAIGLTVNAMRGMDRWKCSGILNRSFSGFMALPASNAIVGKNWWEVMGYQSIPSSFDLVATKYKDLSKDLHPDRPEGSKEKFQELVEAYSQAKIHFKK